MHAVIWYLVSFVVRWRWVIDALLGVVLVAKARHDEAYEAAQLAGIAELVRISGLQNPSFADTQDMPAVMFEMKR